MILCSKFSVSQTTPGIIQDWADYIGYQDTLVRIPVLQDGLGNIVTAGFTLDSLTGADLLVAKYKQAGELIWQRTYSGAGYNRDQATALALDDSNNVYVAGAVFSASTNYDFVLLKYDSAGLLQWSAMYNGSADNYDGPCAVSLRDSFVYVTGAVNNAGTFLDLVTIQYNAFTGAQNWVRTYDYAGLSDVPVAIETNEDGEVMVTGASQQTVNDWSYVVLTFSYAGTPSDTLREDGTANGFDRANAVKNDGAGNFFITGASAVNGEGFNIKTLKINTADTIEWIAQYNTNGIDLDDEGNGIATDDSGKVYVAGVAYRDNEDYVLIKYDASGTEEWIKYFNNTGIDVAKAICLDSYGNIVVTGVSANATNDILTVAYDSQGNELWHDYFDGANHDDDYATDIIAGSNGHIYVTGQSGDGAGGFEQVTIKYSTDYFLVPQDTVPAPSSLLFYPNAGQIIDTQDSIRYDVSFYTINQFPKLYFHRDSISFVLAHVDSDTATSDTLERITMNFANGNMAYCDPYPTNTHDTDQVLNYFLGHCPDGITGITGSEKIMYSGVYDNTDVIFSNNNAGMKFQIIMNPGAEPQAVLHFTGHQGLQLVNNADLQVSGVLGSFTYERPLVYQLDGEGNRISLGWLASYLIVDSANVAFQLPGNYDSNKPLVVECAREVIANLSSSIDNFEWSTFYGGNIDDYETRITTSSIGNCYMTGTTGSTNFPVTPGAIQTLLNFDEDCFIVKFSSIGNPNTHTNVLWATYYGGSGLESPAGIALNNTEEYIYIVGNTWAGNTGGIPTFTSSSGGNFNYSPLQTNFDDGFVLKLNDAGNQVLWCSTIGGTEVDRAYAITVDQSDYQVYIVGATTTSQSATNVFPLLNSSNLSSYNQNVYAGGTAPGFGDAFIMKFDDEDNLLWSTYYGGSGEDKFTSIKVGTYFVNGTPAKLISVVGLTNSTNPNNPTTVGQPCIANNSGELQDCDPGGGAYYQNSNAGSNDGLIVGFNTDDQLIWGTFFGGTSFDAISEIESGDPSDNSLLITGETNSASTFPIYPVGVTNYYKQTHGGNSDAFIGRFNNFIQDWTTYIGGANLDAGNCITLDEDYNCYIGGITSSPTPSNSCSPPANVGEFPVCNSAGGYYTQSFGVDQNAFVAGFNRSNQMIWSTYVGGTINPNGANIKSEVISSLSCFRNDKLYFSGHAASPSPTPFPQIQYTDLYWQNGNLNTPNYVDAIVGRFDLLNVVGINEINIDSVSISLFPNPALNYVNIKVRFASKFRISSPLTIQLFDAVGQCKSTQKLISNNFLAEESISLDGCSSGIYLLNFQIENKNISQKLIINK